MDLSQTDNQVERKKDGQRPPERQRLLETFFSVQFVDPIVEQKLRVVNKDNAHTGPVETAGKVQDGRHRSEQGAVHKRSQSSVSPKSARLLVAIQIVLHQFFFDAEFVVAVPDEPRRDAGENHEPERSRDTRLGRRRREELQQIQVFLCFCCR